VITPKAVTETTPLVTAQIKQRDLVVASLLAVRDNRAGGDSK
jgi:hypothetical protein